MSRQRVSIVFNSVEPPHHPETAHFPADSMSLCSKTEPCEWTLTQTERLNVCEGDECVGLLHPNC